MDQNKQHQRVRRKRKLGEHKEEDTINNEHDSIGVGEVNERKCKTEIPPPMPPQNQLGPRIYRKKRSYQKNTSVDLVRENEDDGIPTEVLALPNSKSSNFYLLEETLNSCRENNESCESDVDNSVVDEINVIREVEKVKKKRREYVTKEEIELKEVGDNNANGTKCRTHSEQDNVFGSEINEVKGRIEGNENNRDIEESEGSKELINDYNINIEIDDGKDNNVNVNDEDGTKMNSSENDITDTSYTAPHVTFAKNPVFTDDEYILSRTDQEHSVKNNSVYDCQEGGELKVTKGTASVTNPSDAVGVLDRNCFSTLSLKSSIGNIEPGRSLKDISFCDGIPLLGFKSPGYRPCKKVSGNSMIQTHSTNCGTDTKEQKQPDDGPFVSFFSIKNSHFLLRNKFSIVMDNKIKFNASKQRPNEYIIFQSEGPIFYLLSSNNSRFYELLNEYGQYLMTITVRSQNEPYIYERIFDISIPAKDKQNGLISQVPQISTCGQYTLNMGNVTAIRSIKNSILLNKRTNKCVLRLFRVSKDTIQVDYFRNNFEMSDAVIAGLILSAWDCPH